MKKTKVKVTRCQCGSLKTTDGTFRMPDSYEVAIMIERADQIEFKEELCQYCRRRET